MALVENLDRSSIDLLIELNLQVYFLLKNQTGGVFFNIKLIHDLWALTLTARKLFLDIHQYFTPTFTKDFIG